MTTVDVEKHVHGSEVVGGGLKEEKHRHHRHHLGGGYRSRFASAVRFRQPRRAAISMCLVTLLLLAGITALIVWLVYRPHQPKFRVISAAIYELNATSPPYITTNMQFTLVTRNSNRRTSFDYDRLSIFVAYRNQAITPPTLLPPLHHHTKSSVALSPVIGGAGAAVPVSPEVSNGLGMDSTYGAVALRLVLTGRIKYRAGGIRSGRYGIYVKCDVLVGFRRGFSGPVPLLTSPEDLDCNVDV